MQGDCNRLSRIRVQHYVWAVNSYARLSVPAVRQKLLRDQTVKLRSRPARLHEQRMNTCERINAPFDQFLEIVRRTGMRKTHRRLHGGQDVLCSMLGLAREIDDLCLGPSTLRACAFRFLLQPCFVAQWPTCNTPDNSAGSLRLALACTQFAIRIWGSCWRVLRMS